MVHRDGSALNRYRFQRNMLNQQKLRARDHVRPAAGGLVSFPDPSHPGKGLVTFDRFSWSRGRIGT